MLKKWISKLLCEEYKNIVDDEGQCLQGKVDKFVSKHIFGLVIISVSALIVVYCVGMAALVGILILEDLYQPAYYLVLIAIMTIPMRFLLRIMIVELVGLFYGRRKEKR